MRTSFLPFALPDTDETEIKEVVETIRSGWVTTGPKTHQFEAEFAAAVGARHAIAVNSCTAALHLALEAIHLQPGDFVLTSPYTFAATAEVVRYFNAIPVFVDVEPDTLNIDPQGLVEAIQDLQCYLATGRFPRTAAVRRAFHQRGQWPAIKRQRPAAIKAIIPVHFAGLPADLDIIYTIAAEYDLAVIEDAAHAFPAKYKEHFIGSASTAGHTSTVDHGPRTAANRSAAHRLPAVGSLSSAVGGQPAAVCFSFYATKTITTGEGGMICTDDETVADRCRIMALHGISKDAWKRYTAEGSWYYEIIEPGYKYNLTDIAAAMGVVQLQKAERMWRRRREIARRYNNAFKHIPQLQIPGDWDDCQHAWHLYMLRLDLERLHFSRAQFIELLAKRMNIGASVHFIPLHLHPYYRQTYGYSPNDFPVAFAEYQRVVSLPLYSRMSDQDVEDVIQAVKVLISK